MFSMLKYKLGEVKNVVSNKKNVCNPIHASKLYSNPVQRINPAAAAAAASWPLSRDNLEISEDPSAPSLLLSSLKLSLPESLTPQSSADWSNWIAEELAVKLVGVSARTSRAKVFTVGVRSANVVKGAIRAEEVDVLLEVEGHHTKEDPEATMHGVIRVILKTQDSKDQICVSDAVWDPEVEGSQLLSKQAQADIAAAAGMPLESALALRFNDLLWDVEKRSIDQSMDEEGGDVAS
ncbi:hypothetical protein CEUSTIGMA_g12667.t1 [Chlamydomonas eustigma]|uniref:Uncharacterized protein n=1 Tax=Chlamydomonas eustigma TaxID=1157962 RepID=A0A250XQ97_9CHLO|nr:hypothetical protein CEUSTIGMA_g12667.t1 [Chlamydomonas eustigma]|eukprot:GAX85247.1 hypothetical protein CEUSTIGMA_g12667.t1 [Chlamydomonas eustigma]